MKHVRIGFSKSDSFLGLAIRIVLGTTYNHVFIVMEDKKIYQADTRGVTCCDSLDDMDVVFLFGKKIDDNRYEEIKNYLDSQLGKKYQFVSLLSILFHIPMKDRGDKRHICSELAARAFYEELGYESYKDALDKITPKNIFKKVQEWHRLKRMIP